MKEVICSQMKVMEESDLKHVYGGAGDRKTNASQPASRPATRPANTTSRSDAAQIVISGSQGCVAGARNAQQSRKANDKPPR